jgi:cytidine deaminase
MKEEYKFSYDVYDSINDIKESDASLLKKAIALTGTAYAPYSKFNVSAVARLSNGELVTGTNQENASYPIGLCAERVAVFAAAANFPGVKIKAIAITALSKQFLIDKPITPCGSCRQAIAEYEHRYNNPIRLIMTGETGKVLVADSIVHFLPYQFNGDDLKVK